MIIVAGTIRVPAARLEEILPLARDTIAATRAEKGCITYSFAADLADPGLIRIFERWESMADLERHGSQPHMDPWRAKLREVGVSDRDILSYEAGEGSPVA